MKKTLIIQFIEGVPYLKKKYAWYYKAGVFFLHAGQNGKQNGQQPNFI